MKDSPKVFGIGLSRTGTTSLTQALSILGYRSVHWPHDALTQAELLGYFAGFSNFHLTVADEFDAVTDTPAASVFRELSAAYNNSKFVLTVRDLKSWLESCNKFWSQPGHSGPPISAYRVFCHAVRTRLYGTPDFDEALFSFHYHKHAADVQAWFGIGNRLLVLDICGGEGWSPLCRFLGHPRPALPFPRLNEGEALMEIPIRQTSKPFGT